MAEVVTGAMGTLLPKLADLIMEEYNLQRALLRISEAPIDQPPDIQVKLWAKAVRDLSYDLEDSIDKFMVRIETHGRPDKSHSFMNFIDKSLSLLTKGKIRHKIGIDIKDIKSRIKEVSERRDRYKVDTLYRKATKLVGTDEKSVEVIKMLTEGDMVSQKQLKVVSIVGFGGLGKTTLANAVYEKFKVQEDNQDRSSNSLLHQLDKHRIQNTNEASWGEEQLIREIRTFLENKRYLIVIDTRVIATTRILDVAQQAGGVYRLNPLSVVESRKLFYQRIYDMENKSPPNQLVEVSEKILRRCGGVPLAILTIGSLLDIEKGRAHTHEYWSRYCLLHLSLYPEDYVIETEQLIWKWVGEGSVRKEQGKSLYEVGEDYLNELINKSLLQLEELRMGIKYLCLKGTSITKIPKEIGNLQFLQVLDIRSTRIAEELPSTFIRLTQLLLVHMFGSIACAVPRCMCSMSFLMSLNITVKTLGEEDLQVLGNIPSLSELCMHWLPFPCLTRFKLTSNTMELRFARGAMQCLQTLWLCFNDVHDTLLQFGDFLLDLENLSSMVILDFFSSKTTKHADVRLAVEKEIDLNLNSPN
nr:NBS-LRR disease resistance protein [Dasypyrum villosum]